VFTPAPVPVWIPAVVFAPAPEIDGGAGAGVTRVVGVGVALRDASWRNALPLPPASMPGLYIKLPEILGVGAPVAVAPGLAGLPAVPTPGPLDLVVRVSPEPSFNKGL
jgi:hypothetical protein